MPPQEAVAERMSLPGRSRPPGPFAGQTLCPGPLDRRSFLTIGGLSLGALTSGLSPNLPQLLASEERSAELESQLAALGVGAAAGAASAAGEGEEDGDVDAAVEDELDEVVEDGDAAPDDESEEEVTDASTEDEVVAAQDDSYLHAGDRSLLC